MKYVYKPLNASPACSSLPRGWDYFETPPELAKRLPQLPASRHEFGLIGYGRQLSDEEVQRYGLEYMGVA